MEVARFLPSPGRGAAVDKAVRHQLALSLESLYARAGSVIGYEENSLLRLLEDLRRGPCRPAAFGTYTALVESISADAVDETQRLSDELLVLRAPRPGTHVVTLRDDDLGLDQARRYARLVDDDPDEPIFMQKVGNLPLASVAVSEALSLIKASNPLLASEITELTREIVVAEPVESNETGVIAKFDGASTFYLWGAVFMRITGRSRVDLAQTLAHETGHLLLFGLMMGQPLVENIYGERYNSPLRRDPRPMEGLVHAAYVLARMHYCLEALVSSDLLSSKEQVEARSEMDKHRVRFDVAKETIDDRARFTTAGAEIFRDAVEYMKASPQSVAVA